jgi:hypothetical protein
MAAFFVDGATIEPPLLGTNDGLNYGRFDAPGLEVHAYEVRIGIEEVLAAMSAEFEKLVEEMRTDDLLDDEPSALMRMGYPTMRDAFAHPDDLREVIRIFMHREILWTFARFSEQSQYIINSTDAIHVDPNGLRFVGRCFARRWP